MLCILFAGFSVFCFPFELFLPCASNFLLLSICQSEMTVVLCQTSYTPDWNPFTFHLNLISFLISMLFTGWTKSQFMPSLIYYVPQRYRHWPTTYRIPLSISVQYDTASCVDGSHSLCCSSSYLICYTAFLLAHAER